MTPATTLPSGDAPRDQRGLSIVEALATLFLIQVALLAIAPMFLYAMRGTASAGSMGQVGAAAVARFEQLRTKPFKELVAGGSLATNATGYSDTTLPAVIVRWTIADDAAQATQKTIIVVAQARNAPVGKAKQVRLACVRAR